MTDDDFIRSHVQIITVPVPTPKSGRCIVCETTVRVSGRDIGEQTAQGWIHDFCAAHASPCFDRDLGAGVPNRFGLCALCGGPLDRRERAVLHSTGPRVHYALFVDEDRRLSGPFRSKRAAQAAVDAANATYCPHHPEAVQVGCTNPRHDHFGGRDNIANGGAPGPVDTDQLHCNDCGLPAHYDSGDEQYHHDDPRAPACFLIRN